MNEKIISGVKVVSVVLALFTMLFAGYMHIDERYALAKDQAKLNSKINSVELKILLKDALDDLYFYREQLRKHPNDVEIQLKVQRGEENVKFIKNQLKVLKK